MAPSICRPVNLSAAITQSSITSPPAASRLVSISVPFNMFRLARRARYSVHFCRI